MSGSSSIFIRRDEKIGYRLEAEMTVNFPREEVFDVFADAMELERITPPWLRFSVITPQPIVMREGLLLDYRLKIHQIPIRWRTQICNWERPIRFVDQQLTGPYKRWFHEHTFEDLHDGRTLVRDNVHYVPRGGELLHHFVVRPDLEKIFRFRQDRLSEIFARKIAIQALAVDSSTTQLGLPTVNQLEMSREFNS